MYTGSGLTSYDFELKGKQLILEGQVHVDKWLGGYESREILEGEIVRELESVTDKSIRQSYFDATLSSVKVFDVFPTSDYGDFFDVDFKFTLKLKLGDPNNLDIVSSGLSSSIDYNYSGLKHIRRSHVRFSSLSAVVRELLLISTFVSGIK